MGEGINIYRPVSGREGQDPLGKKGIQDKLDSVSSTPQGKFDRRKYVITELEGLDTVDAQGRRIEIDEREAKHLGNDFSSKVLLGRESMKNILSIIKNDFSKLMPFDDAPDSDYDIENDTFMKTHSTPRKLFEHFWYYKIPLNDRRFIMLEVGRTSERDENRNRILNEKGEPQFHYYLHAVKKKKNESH